MAAKKAGRRAGGTARKAGIYRRTPRQERSVARVERILDAAAALIREGGVEAATTNAIAARAEVSVGSLYQFFPHREAVLQALAARYAARFREVSATALPLELALLPLEALLDRLLPTAVDFYADRAFHEVFRVLGASGKPSPVEADLHGMVMRTVEAVTRLRAPHVRDEVVRVHAAVAFQLAHALLSYAAGAPADIRRGVPGRLRALLLAHSAHLAELEAAAVRGG